MKTWAGIRAGMAVGLCCFGLVSPTLSQQGNTGEIHGHVTDALGAAIAKASVFVRSAAPPGDTIRLATHKDDNGDFVLVLAEGGYDVLVTLPGFQAAVQTLPVLHGKRRSTRWKLQIVPCDFPGTVCDSFR